MDNIFMEGSIKTFELKREPMRIADVGTCAALVSAFEAVNRRFSAEAERERQRERVSFELAVFSAVLRIPKC